MWCQARLVPIRGDGFHPSEFQSLSCPVAITEDGSNITVVSKFERWDVAVGIRDTIKKLAPRIALWVDRHVGPKFAVSLYRNLRQLIFLENKFWIIYEQQR